jgi:hypothetical protein
MPTQMAESSGEVGARNGLNAHNLSVSLCDQSSGISLNYKQKSDQTKSLKRKSVSFL